MKLNTLQPSSEAPPVPAILTFLLFFRYASSVKDGSQYFVLLIVTDGVISDMAQTKESIVNVSKTRVSVTPQCPLG